LTGCATPYKQAATEETYVAAIIYALPPGEVRESLQSYPGSEGFHPEGFLSFGRGICEELRKGTSESQLINGSFDGFFGPELAKAMVQAARNEICPDVK
jgi:hypothetical protein